MFYQLFIIITTLISIYIWYQKHYYYLSWKLGGSFGYPFIGCLLRFKNKDDVLQKLKEEEGKYLSPYVEWLGPHCVVFASDPDTMKTILTHPKCVNKGFFYSFLRDFAGDSLFTLDVPLWNTRIKIIKPPFKRRMVLGFYSIFNEEANKLNRRIEEISNKKDFSLFFNIQLAVLTATCQTTLGDSHSVAEKVDYKSILEAFSTVMEAIVDRMFNPFYFSSTIYSLTNHFKHASKYKTIIEEFLQNKLITKKLQLAQLKESLSNLDENIDEDQEFKLPPSLLEYILVNNEDNLSIDELRNEVLVMISAGFETTAIALYCAILCLAMHDKEQEKLYEELYDVMPDANSDITEEHLKLLKYTEMCISEVMRVIPPVPIVGRTTMEQIKLNNGVILEKGTDVMLDIFSMHRSNKHWGPNATTFNPDNFHPDKIKYYHPYAYIPFTRGSRMCVGFKYSIALMKIFIAKIFRNFKVTTNMKFEDLQFVENISIQIKNHPTFKFEKRIK